MADELVRWRRTTSRAEVTSPAASMVTAAARRGADAGPQSEQPTVVMEEASRIEGHVSPLRRWRNEIGGRSARRSGIASQSMTETPTGHPRDGYEWAKTLIAAPLTEPETDELIEAARSAEPDGAQMAAWALGFGEIPENLLLGAVRALLDVLVDSTCPGPVRGQAAEAVAEQLEFSDHLDPARLDAETSLTDMLNDPSAQVRFWCAFGLGKLQTTAALPTLRALTVDTTSVPGWWTVGEEASDAINTIEGRQPPERIGLKT